MRNFALGKAIASLAGLALLVIREEAWQVPARWHVAVMHLSTLLFTLPWDPTAQGGFMLVSGFGALSGLSLADWALATTAGGGWMRLLMRNVAAEVSNAAIEAKCLAGTAVVAIMGEDIVLLGYPTSLQFDND